MFEVKKVQRWDLDQNLDCIMGYENGRFVSYEDYVALQQKLDAMAAENAALKSFINKSCFVEDDSSDYGFSNASASMPRTQVTEYYLNLVRAEGIYLWIESRGGRWNGTVKEAETFAQKLRSGTHDTADKAG